MNTASPLLLSYYGDDFTGSTDALEFLTRAGVRTALFIAPPSPAVLSRYPGLQALGVAGLTRSMGPAEMRATLRPSFDALKSLGTPHVHYKVCSTFDSSPSVGSIGLALDIGSEVFGSSCVPLLVGAPPLGRYCVFGNLFARMGIGTEGGIHRLDRHPSMSRHPSTPADESDLLRHLSRQTRKRGALFDILQVSLPLDKARQALQELLRERPEIVLFDVLATEQFRTIGALLEELTGANSPLFSVGSSAVEMALGAHWTAQGRLTPHPSWPSPGPADPLLVLSGSCSPVTAGQIAWAEFHGFVCVKLDADALVAGADLSDCVRSVVDALARRRHVVAYTNRGLANPDEKAAPSSLLGTALGRIARAALEATDTRRLLLAGGDSSSYAARALGIEAVEMIAPLAPGAPLCRACAPGSPIDGREVNFKGGQVGPENYFGLVAEGSSVSART